MKPRRLFLFGLLCVSANVFAAGGVELPGYQVEVDLSNEAALQRGAKYFVNYCLNCHSRKDRRYSRIADDLGMTHDMMRDNLVFTGVRVSERMEVAMDPDDAEEWFGASPPDLSVMARQKGSTSIYQYLMTFYADESRPWGVNNWRFPNTTMPHVLWREQGIQQAHWTEEPDAAGTMRKVIKELTPGTPGRLTPEEYQKMVRDVTSFLVYVSEPARVTRETAGVWVLLFLLVFIGLTYFLKREYWKDVH